MSADKRPVAPIKLLVIVDQAIDKGGGHQQSLNAVVHARRLDDRVCETTVVTTIRENVDALKALNIDADLLELTSLQRLYLRARSRLFSPRLLSLADRLLGRNPLDRWLNERGPDLLYFTSPSDLCLLTEQYPYILTVFDLCHRDHMEFPEVSSGREFERRESLYTRALPKATGIVVDSEVGKTEVSKRYRVDEQRIIVQSYSPAPGTLVLDTDYKRHCVDIKRKYAIETDYVYYPAQFWPHKNHVAVLDGLKILESRYDVRLTAVFSGGDKGNQRYLEEKAKELDLADRIRFVGFVPNEEIPYLYRQSVALVMPTWFGPTNLPPLEAFRLGVPVIYSDLPGLRDQTGAAALLIDPGDPETLALAMHKLCTEPGLTARLVEQGRIRLAELEQTQGSAALERCIAEFSLKRRCWGRRQTTPC